MLLPQPPSALRLRDLLLAPALVAIAVHSTVGLKALVPALEMWCVSDETRAFATLRKIASLEEQAREGYGKNDGRCQYFDMSELRRRMWLEEELGGGIQAGYRYDLRIDREGWSCVATPVVPRSQCCTLFVDTSGEISALGNPPAHEYHLENP